MNLKPVEFNYTQSVNNVKFTEEPKTFLIKEPAMDLNVSLDGPPLDFSNMEIQTLECKFMSDPD